MSAKTAMCGLGLFASLAVMACTIGTIEGSEPEGHVRRDTGPSKPGTLSPDDPAPPPPGDPPYDPPGGDASVPPSTDSAPPGDTAPPPPKTDTGTAPPPPSDSGAPPPPSDSGTTTTPPSTGAYPSGPYGFTVGSVFPNAKINGYRDGTGSWVSISMADYYDPDGSRKINGIYIDSSAAWCQPCRDEAAALPAMYTSKYKSRGAKFLNALIENTSSGPATQSTVDSWVSAFKINFDVAADPSRALLPSGGVALPHQCLIDPRTMKVVKVWEGADPSASSVPGLDALLTTNGG